MARVGWCARAVSSRSLHEPIRTTRASVSMWSPSTVPGLRQLLAADAPSLVGHGVPVSLAASERTLFVAGWMWSWSAEDWLLRASGPASSWPRGGSPSGVDRR